MGALPAPFAGRGWEGHALNLRNHFWSQTADPATLDIESYTEDVVAAMERLGPTSVAVGHGMGGLLVLKAIERAPVAAYVLIAPETPRELREPARPTWSATSRTPTAAPSWAGRRFPRS